MCLNIPTKEKDTQSAVKIHMKIAEEDITCFKVVSMREGKVKSYYKGFPYEFGEEYKTRIECRFSFYYDELVINEGFHSYANKDLHNGTTLWVELNDGGILVECIIPKGSQYFEHANYLCSNKIKIKKCV